MITTLWWCGGRSDLETSLSCWSGDRWSAARCNAPVRYRLSGGSRAFALSWAVLSRTLSMFMRNFEPGRQSRCGADQRHIDAILPVCCPPARDGFSQRPTAVHIARQSFRESVWPLNWRKCPGRPPPMPCARLDAECADAFFVIPSAVAFLALGDVIAAALLQTGRFRPTDANYVSGILAGSAVGLLASTLGRLYASSYYALRDTRTPLRYALVRVTLTAALGYVAAMTCRSVGHTAALGGELADCVGGGCRLGRDVSPGTGAAFVINAAAYVVSAWCISTVPLPPTPTAERLSTEHSHNGWQDFWQGLRYMRARLSVLRLLSVKAWSAGVAGGLLILFALFAEHLFQAGAIGYGHSLYDSRPRRHARPPPGQALRWRNPGSDGTYDQRGLFHLSELSPGIRLYANATPTTCLLLVVRGPRRHPGGANSELSPAGEDAV